jgi:GAF domain-containing protein
MQSTDHRVYQVLVALADTLSPDFELTDFLNGMIAQFAELIGIPACGVLLADATDVLGVGAATTPAARRLEIAQLTNSEGPGLDCFHNRSAVRCPDLSHADSWWPSFVPAARTAGFRAIHSWPMRLRDQSLGSVDAFHTEGGPLDAARIDLGQALADAATIGILAQRALRQTETVNEQLPSALHSRIVIEQAKGVLAERLGIAVDDAFDLLRRHARDKRRKLSELARDVVNGRAVRRIPTPAVLARRPRQAAAAGE